MAITRHTNSRQLRSRRIVATLSGKSSQSRGIRASCHRLSTASKQLKGGKEPSATLRSRSNLTATSHLPLSPPMSDQSSVVAYIGSLNVMPREEGQIQVTSVQENPPVNLDDVGLPLDGLWDHDAAYGCRFCYHHREYEYLLGTPNRWMHPTDFGIPDAADVLETLLQKHKKSASKFEPHARRCQADCWGKLLSHVHAVIEKVEHGTGILYLIEWKACYTPESKIPHMDWVLPSLVANENPRCRRSTRLEDGSQDRRKKHEEMMVVVNLDLTLEE